MGREDSDTNQPDSVNDDAEPPPPSTQCVEYHCAGQTTDPGTAPDYQKAPRGRPQSTRPGTCPIGGCRFSAAEGPSKGSQLAGHVNKYHVPIGITDEDNAKLCNERGLTRCKTCEQYFTGTPNQHTKKCNDTMDQRSKFEDAVRQGETAPSSYHGGTGGSAIPEPIPQPRHVATPIEEFTAKKVLTLRTLDPSSRPGWASRCRGDVLARAMHAKREDRQSLLEKLIELPRNALPAPAKALNKRQREIHTAATLMGDTSKARARKVTETRPPLDPDVAAVQRAAKATKQGALGKAIRTLADTSKVAPRNEDTAVKIEKLHPPEPGPMPRRPDMPYIHVRHDIVRTVVRSVMTRGSAPSIDGWTRELLLPLVDDPVCLKGLTMIVEDILNGNISEWSREIMTACEVCPFVKPNGGIRPIAPESALLKLACLVALMMVRPVIAQVLATEQHGVGHPGGPEAAAHRIRAAILDSQENTAIDMENAYNCLFRHKMLEKLYKTKELSPTWVMADILYGSPSTNYFYGNEGELLRRISSSRGVRQGCVLAPLLFALGIDDALRKLAAACPKDSVTAYLDDVHASCKWATFKAAYDIFRQDCEDVGLTVNAGKTEHLAPIPCEDHPTKTDFIRTLGSVSGCDKVMGGIPVGNNTRGMIEFCNDVARASRQLFERLAHAQLPTRIADKLLRVCMGPRMNFLLRSTPPHLTEECAVIFDTMYETCVRSLVGDDTMDDPTSKSLLYSPFRVGGDGHRLCQTVQRFAYGTSCPEGTKGHLPGSQDDYTQLAEDAAFRALHLEGDRMVAALSACGPQGSALFRTNGDDIVDDISDDAYVAAIRMRIGVDPIDNMTWRCDCKRPEGIEARDHAMCCPHTKGDSKRQRHDLIKSAIVDKLREAGFEVHPEPPNYDDESNKRPDILVRIGATWYAVEVSVTHPLQLAHRYAASVRQGAAVEACIAGKHRKYDAICAAKKPQRHTLIVCAVETYGLVSDEFLKFARMAERTSHKTSLAMEGWADRLFVDVSRALHQGNLIVWRKYVAGARRVD